MNRIWIPDGYWGEALPTGERAVLVPGGVQTHLGFVPEHSEAGRPLYVRITNVGGFAFAGQQERGHGTLSWAGVWARLSQIPTGASGCIFDRTGALHIIEPGPGVTSQGYRYVTPDNRLVLGDDTYAPLHGVSEWTDLSLAQDRSLVVGQGNPGGGIRVWDGAGGVLRELEPGPYRGIRANRMGDLVAITAWREGGGTVIYTGTIAQLRRLSVVDPAPEPTPLPPPDPEEDPVPVQRLLPTPVHATITAVVAKYPHTGDESARRAAMQKLVATVRARHGEQYVWKSEHNPDPATGSKDGMGALLPDLPPEPDGRRTMVIWDLIDGATREVKPPHLSEPARPAFVVPVAARDWLAGEPHPDPEPVPDPTLSARVRVLEQELTLLLERLDAEEAETAKVRLALKVKQEMLDDLDARLKRLEQAPTPVPAPGLVDPVATGSVSFADVLSGRRLVWTVKSRKDL